MTFRRYELLQTVAPLITDELLICNIGFPSQELYGIRDHKNFFYMLGSMGLSSSIGLGLSLTTDKTVISIDGDGSVLMNLGTFATIANQAAATTFCSSLTTALTAPRGDQPTYTAGKTSLAAIAKGAGIDSVIEVDGRDIAACLESCIAADGPHVIVAKVDPGTPPVQAIPLSPAVIRDRFRDAVAG